MFYSGIADEASPSLGRQIEAHRTLGWSHIELRNVDGKNVTDLPDDVFDHVARKIEESGLRVSCFASQLANWSRPIDSDFEKDSSELRRAIPRMKRLDVPFIRCMSYPNAKVPWGDPEWRRETVRRMKILAAMAEEGDVTLVHENCSGWGGKGPAETLELLAEVGSERLKLVFDTGNPAQYKQDAWDYYEGVRDHVVYVHVKDYTLSPGKEEVAVFPGAGDCSVREIISDLFARGYDGGFSIEPHITSVIHLRQEASDPELAYRTYLDYGRRFEALVRAIKGSEGGC
jgi:sugar phosphate isomerase/epimerase